MDFIHFSCGMWSEKIMDDQLGCGISCAVPSLLSKMSPLIALWSLC